ncbi:unnamed protein product [Rhodiola kirilowii]
MERGITKLKNILEGLNEPQFSSEDYMMLYTTIYNMCTQKAPHTTTHNSYTISTSWLLKTTYVNV